MLLYHPIFLGKDQHFGITLKCPVYYLEGAGETKAGWLTPIWKWSLVCGKKKKKKIVLMKMIALDFLKNREFFVRVVIILLNDVKICKNYYPFIYIRG